MKIVFFFLSFIAISAENILGNTIHQDPLNFATIEKVLLLGARMDTHEGCKDDQGRTPLHAVVDINAQSQCSGKTPLHEAVEEGYLPTIQFLVELGADMTIRDNDGKTALDHAEESDNQQVIDWIEEIKRLPKDLTFQGRPVPNVCMEALVPIFHEAYDIDLKESTEKLTSSSP